MQILRSTPDVLNQLLTSPPWERIILSLWGPCPPGMGRYGIISRYTNLNSQRKGWVSKLYIYIIKMFMKTPQKLYCWISEAPWLPGKQWSLSHRKASWRVGHDSEILGIGVLTGELSVWSMPSHHHIHVWLEFPQVHLHLPEILATLMWGTAVQSTDWTRTVSPKPSLLSLEIHPLLGKRHLLLLLSHFSRVQLCATP